MDNNGSRLPEQFNSKIAAEKVNKIVFRNNRKQLSFSLESIAKASFACYNGLKEISCEILFDEILLSPQSPLEFNVKIMVVSI